MLAVVAGAMLPLQAVINAKLGRAVGSALWAAAISGLVLTVVLALVAFAGLPWWAWTGGLCGAVVLSATTAIAPRLGTANMIALIMAGQVVCSLVLDHFGLLGLTVHPVDPRRLAAAALLIAGAVLMR